MDREIAINRLEFIFGLDNVIVETGMIKILIGDSIKYITIALIDAMNNESSLDFMVNKLISDNTKLEETDDYKFYKAIINNKISFSEFVKYIKKKKDEHI